MKDIDKNALFGAILFLVLTIGLVIIKRVYELNIRDVFLFLIVLVLFAIISIIYNIINNGRK